MRRPPLPAWVGPYIGAPYVEDATTGSLAEGFNCWGLFAHVQRAVFGVELPDYDGPVWAGRQGAAAMKAAAEAFAARFMLVVDGPSWRAGDRCERAGDGVLLRVAAAPVHIGVVVDPGRMLHTDKTLDACVERYDDPLWVNRVVAIYRAHGPSDDTPRAEHPLPPAGDCSDAATGAADER